MKRYITSFLLVAVLGVAPLFGLGGGFNGFPGLGSPFPGFNPDGIGSNGAPPANRNRAASVLVGVGKWHYALTLHLRLTVNRIQFLVNGTYSRKTIDSSHNYMVFGGVGYHLVNAEKFTLTGSVVAGYTNVAELFKFFTYGVEFLAMLRTGKHFGIYAAATFTNLAVMPELEAGVAYNF